MIEIHDFTDYKAYLKKALLERAKEQKGARSRLAEFIGCGPGYISQVLEGKSELSFDQADAASTFLGHSEAESQYFILLVMHRRAISKSLRERTEQRIAQSQERFLNLKNRFKIKDVSPEHQAVLYSSWQYLAVLTMLGIPGYQSLEALAKRFHLKLRRVSDIVNELRRAGMVEAKGDKLIPGMRRTHLSKDSPMLVRHHVNWRMRAINNIESMEEKSLHFSGVASVSEKDYDILRKKFTKILEEMASVIGPSPPEKGCVICVDLFEL